MGKFIDLAGRKFNRLTVIDESGRTKDGRVVWKCLCDCGNEKNIDSKSLKTGNTKSCGCYGRESASKRFTTHGHRSRDRVCNDRLYSIWGHVKERCCNTKSMSYQHYGGRGITICDEWSNSFETFRDWAYANGYSDDLTIDRIDNDGNYEPGNCRWADMKTQANNKRNNVFVNYNGNKYTMSQLASETRINYRTLLYRYQHGWSDSAIVLPVSRNGDVRP